MNDKGQVSLPVVLSVFIGVIVGLVLLTGAFSYIGTSTSTASISQGQYTSPANGVTVDLIGQELLSTPVVSNRTGTVITAGNYTIAETISAVDGLKRISYTTLTTEYQSQPINVSYDYGPEGYIESAGGRSVAGLIAIFGALAIAIIALVPVLQSKGVFG